MIKREGGGYDAQAVARETHYHCYHCGGIWLDTTETRKALDASSYFVPLNPTASAENIGFSWPAWAGQRLAWGGDMIMLGWLQAKRRDKEYGDKEPLKQWYQKRAGKS